jgi:hypothetical protein
MSLLTDYTSRVNTQLRTNFSNPGNSTATTPNTALETLAASDVTGRFQTICGVVYDSTQPAHVDSCINLMMLKLQSWTGQITPADYEAAAEYLDTLKDTLGRDRLTPYTDSTLTRTPDPTGATVSTDWTKSIGIVPTLPGNTFPTADGFGTNG